MYLQSENTDIYLAPANQVLLSKFTHLSNKQLFVLVDSNSKKHCWPLLKELSLLNDAEIIEMETGEKAKSVDTVMHVWKMLTDAHADRGSVLLNLGGGVVGDLGGFAASCYKRGIEFIQVPTTLLSMVDASVGGKTGVNFAGLKNQIGAFAEPMSVIIDPAFLRTLNKRHLLSGWAEMIKHALLQGPDDFYLLTQKPPEQLTFKELNKLIARSVKIKQQVVMADPREQGERKVLNLGHTVGHAIESLAMQLNLSVLHGEAVAYGLAVELIIAREVLQLDAAFVEEVVNYVLKMYKLPFESFNKKDLVGKMQHDKKNAQGMLLFALLNKESLPQYDVRVSEPMVEQALDEFANKWRSFT